MKYIERAFPWLLLLPALLPVVVWGGIVYPYLVPKTLLFYTVSLLALAAFGLLIGKGYAFRYGRLARWETWIPGALLVLAYGASYVGIGFYHSFWSIFARGDGLLMLSGVTLSFYLIVLSADRTFFDRLLRAVAAVASFVAVYGIGEWLLSGGRIGSLLGNAAFFAGYLGIAFFATLVSARSLSRGWRRAAYVGAALQVIAIILTATRGSMLALGVALVLWLGYEAFFAKRAGASLVPTLPFAKIARVTLIALVVFGGLFYAFRAQLAQVPFEPIARVASASAHSTDIASRLFIWKHMVGQIEQSPWLGYGAEHIDTLFNRFYDPSQIVEQWFDRSHNAFLDYAAQYGIGGLVLYIALILAFITTAYRFARRGGAKEKRVGVLFTLLAVTYATQNFFVFDTISSFWLLVALLAVFIARAAEETPAVSVALPRAAQYLSWPFALIMVVLIVPVAGRPLVAAYDLAHAYQLALTDPTSSVQYLKDGFALNTYGNLEYGYEAYDMYANHQVKALTGAARTAAYQEAAHILTVDFNRYPYDARTALDLASVLSLAPAGAQVDHQLFSDAIARAIKLSPKRSQSWYLLENVALTKANMYPVGSTARKQGYAAALDLIKKYITLVPTLSEPRYVAAQLELAMGDTKAAAQDAAAGKAYYTSDLKTAERAAAYYENTKDLPNAAFFLAEVVKLDPSNTAAAHDLKAIQAYEQQGK